MRRISPSFRPTFDAGKSGTELTTSFPSPSQVRPKIQRRSTKHSGALDRLSGPQHSRVLPRDGISGASRPLLFLPLVLSDFFPSPCFLPPSRSPSSTQLEERLREVIDPTLRDRVSLQHEKDLFTSVVSSSLLAILRELELTIDPAFAAMSRSPWREAEYVSSESQYVGELERGLKSVVGAVREGVEQKKYVRSTCDKIVGCVTLSPLLLLRV